MFEEITRLPTYYLTRVERALLRRYADDISLFHTQAHHDSTTGMVEAHLPAASHLPNGALTGPVTPSIFATCIS